MAIKLQSIEFIPRGEEGWTTTRREFGNLVTLIKGPNGSGKTPLIIGIVYCLGYKAEFRKDIVDRCSEVRLEFEIDAEKYVVIRPLPNSEAKWRASKIGTELEFAFKTEREFSDWFFDVSHITKPPKLTISSHDSGTEVYSSLLLPCFYVDQDRGWQDLYFSPSKFIKDQTQEMVRIVLGLAPRHAFSTKEALVQERKNFERLDETLAQRNAVLKELSSGIEDTNDDAMKSLESRKKNVASKLGELKEGTGSISQTTAMFDSEMSQVSTQMETHEKRNSLHRARIKSAQIISKEISSEIEALSLNVDAADRFREFCGAENCRMFCKVEQSYGKSLLYLKDQLKDLEVSSGTLGAEVSSNEERIKDLVGKREAIKKTKKETLAKHGLDQLVALIETFSREMVEVETKISLLGKVMELKTKVSNLIERRTAAKIRIEELEATLKGKSDDRSFEIRSALSETMARWIGVLKTPNINGAPHFDERFLLTIGEEKLSAFKGSTLTRLILAYHAAVLETSLANAGNHPGFLILDTPIQQELKVTDLRDYFVELKKLVKGSAGRAQICLSFSDANIKPESEDVLWSPEFKIEKRNMFFGRNSDHEIWS